MQTLKLKEIVAFTKAELLQGNLDLKVKEIVIDSRDVKKGFLFIAIIGQNKDGHQYLKEAVKNGASAVIVDRNSPAIQAAYPNLSVLKVEDTTKALQAIAFNYRHKFDDLKVIGITGSAGKTTTKDMIFSVLSEKYYCLKTEGNYNNQIGLPLTLLRLDGREDFAILEMGMSGLAEIDLLAKIAVPEIGIITNIAAAHLEQLGSLENIAQAKKELIDNLTAADTAILNYDNQYTKKIGTNSKAQTIYFGFEKGADARIENYFFNSKTETLKFEFTYQAKNYKFIFNKAGKHNLYNILPALIIAFKYKLKPEEIQKGLLKTKFSSLRMEFIQLKNKARIINDSYNANPLSVKAALDVLEQIKAKRKIAILASMLELGEKSLKKHQQIGLYAAAKKIDLLITIGPKAQAIATKARTKMKSEQVINLANNKECIDFLLSEIKAEDLILIKGSRANKLEEIVDELKSKEL